MLNIGPQEILLILIVALVVVGPQRLPEMGRTLGRALRELRKAQDEVKRTVAVVLDEPKPANGARNKGASAAAARTTETTNAAGDEAAAADAPTSAPSAAAQAASVLRPLAETARELRKTREEIQRSFRVDLAGPPAVRPSKPAAAETPVVADGGAASGGDAPASGSSDADQGASTT